jgi:hypothetical protein
MLGVAAPRIEGASTPQLEILREIFAGLASTRITSVRVLPYEPNFEGDPVGEAGPFGDELLVTAELQDLRADWEAQIVGFAFARRASEARLGKVAWLAFGNGGTTLEYAGPTAPPMSTESINHFRDEVAAAAGDARLDEFEVLRPQGHAFAILLGVDEPYAFLRSHSRGFLAAVAAWRDRCDGIYAEVRDRAPDPALAVGWYRSGGLSSVRHDVECCAPSLGLSQPIDWQGPPPCPVFG